MNFAKYGTFHTTLRAAPVAEWFTTLSTNLSPSSAVGSNPGDGDLNLHEGKLPVGLRWVGGYTWLSECDM